MKSKHVNKEDTFILDKHGLKRWRSYSLRPSFGKRTIAERSFDRALNEPNREGRKRKYKQVDKKDWEIVSSLMDEFWRLQDEINDEDNSDAHMQRAYMDTQNDILEELEVIYRKYLPVKK